MEKEKETFGMLDLLIHPGFCVRNYKITHLNSAAEALLLAQDMDIRDFLLTGKEEYAAFSGGCLYLNLQILGSPFGASVYRQHGTDIFLLDPQTEDKELRILALAAVELRQPLHTVMISADRLSASGPEDKTQLARLNRGLHQLHRIINNMSDAGRSPSDARQEIRNIGLTFAEIFEKAQSLVEQSGVSLIFSPLSEDILCLADRELLERAVLNMLSNALKFTPEGGRIEAGLSRQGKQLQLRILDSGCGIAENILHNVFTRYQRQPGIEDSRFGLGLGMVLIRSAATAHGGTVLIDQPEGRGTRVTMTMEIRQGKGNFVRTPIDLPGGQDAGLVELSDCLPVSVYEK